MAITTVIFDFDGTVADTNDVVIQSWQHTYKALTGSERPVDEIVCTFGEPLWISMERIFPEYDPEYTMKIYRDYQKNHFNEAINIFPGMDTLMKTLKEKGFKVAMVTSRTRETTLNGMRKFGIEDYADIIVSCDDTKKHKPDPEPVNIALAGLSAKPEEALMVGDSMFDILCAHNAGVKAVLVGWAIAVTDEDMIGPDKPEYVIKNAMDLFDIV